MANEQSKIIRNNPVFKKRRQRRLIGWGLSISLGGAAIGLASWGLYRVSKVDQRSALVYFKNNSFEEILGEEERIENDDLFCGTIREGSKDAFTCYAGPIRVVDFYPNMLGNNFIRKMAGYIRNNVAYNSTASSLRAVEFNQGVIYDFNRGGYVLGARDSNRQKESKIAISVDFYDVPEEDGTRSDIASEVLYPLLTKTPTGSASKAETIKKLAEKFINSGVKLVPEIAILFNQPSPSNGYLSIKNTMIMPTPQEPFPNEAALPKYNYSFNTFLQYLDGTVDKSKFANDFFLTAYILGLTDAPSLESDNSLDVIKQIGQAITKYYSWRNEGAQNEYKLTYFEQLFVKINEASSTITTEAQWMKDLLDYLKFMFSDTDVVSAALGYYVNTSSAPFRGTDPGSTTWLPLISSQNIDIQRKVIARVLRLTSNSPDERVVKQYRNLLFNDRFEALSSKLTSASIFGYGGKREAFYQLFTDFLYYQTLMTVSHEIGHDSTIKLAQRFTDPSSIEYVYEPKLFAATQAGKAILNNFIETLSKDLDPWQRAHFLAPLDNSTLTQTFSLESINYSVSQYSLPGGTLIAKPAGDANGDFNYTFGSWWVADGAMSTLLNLSFATTLGQFGGIVKYDNNGNAVNILSPEGINWPIQNTAQFPLIFYYAIFSILNASTGRLSYVSSNNVRNTVVAPNPLTDNASTQDISKYLTDIKDTANIFVERALSRALPYIPFTKNLVAVILELLSESPANFSAFVDFATTFHYNTAKSASANDYADLVNGLLQGRNIMASRFYDLFLEPAVNYSKSDRKQGTGWVVNINNPLVKAGIINTKWQQYSDVPGEEIYYNPRETTHNNLDGFYPANEQNFITSNLEYTTSWEEMLTRVYQVLTYRQEGVIDFSNPSFYGSYTQTLINGDYAKLAMKGLVLYDTSGKITQKGLDMFDFYRRMNGLVLSDTETTTIGGVKIKNVIGAAQLIDIFTPISVRKTHMSGWISKEDAKKYKYILMENKETGKKIRKRIFTKNASNLYFYTKLFTEITKGSDGQQIMDLSSSKVNDVTGDYVAWQSERFIAGEYSNAEVNKGTWSLTFIEQDISLQGLAINSLADATKFGMQSVEGSRLNFNNYENKFARIYLVVSKRIDGSLQTEMVVT